MPRDKKIKQAFEIADDGIHGAIGYFFYVAACQRIANPAIVADYLPKRVLQGSQNIEFAIKTTHDWIRFYNPLELINSMSQVFLSYHAKTTVISMISIFEGCLSNFEKRLVKLGKMKPIKRNSYKHRLQWAFDIVLKSDYGNPAMIKRLPDLCLDVDHGRRIRNLWMHNRGNYDKFCETDTINVPGHKPLVEQDYLRFKKSPQKGTPFKMSSELFQRLLFSHIELLHHQHNMIQKNCFGQKRWYSYRTVRKNIDWKRLLLGT
jgi:hypothetical protein